MPLRGVTGRWPGFVPAAVALVATAVGTWLFGVAAAAGQESAPWAGVLLLILLPAPLVVAALWGAALLTGRPATLALLAGAVWLVGTLVLVSSASAWSLAGHVAAGLMAGWAIGRRWRLDFALLAVACALVPPLLWSVAEMSPREQIDALSQDMLDAVEQQLPANADEAQRAKALETQKREIERVGAAALKAYPFFIAVVILGQAAIILAGVWLAVRGLGLDPHRWHLPPFGRWRVPFYVVWVVIAGLALLVTRQAPWSDAGLNLVLLGGAVISVQGIAVQFFVTGRMMSVAGRVIYWLVMGVFFAPLVLASGLVLGLADQWWDIRRLDAAGKAEPGADPDAGADADENKELDDDDPDEEPGNGGDDDDTPTGRS